MVGDVVGELVGVEGISVGALVAVAVCALVKLIGAVVGVVVSATLPVVEVRLGTVVALVVGLDGMVGVTDVAVVMTVVIPAVVVVVIAGPGLVKDRLAVVVVETSLVNSAFAVSFPSATRLPRQLSCANSTP